MVKGEINLVYSMNDRYIVGGAVPDSKLELTTIDPLKSEYFCDRRELGIINVGGPATIKVDDVEYDLLTRMPSMWEPDQKRSPC